MIETASLVDQYCHGVLRTELGLATFEAQLGGTARAPAPAPGTTFFDTQTGFAVRRWCPPLLGLEPHCPPARYLARRRELGVLETGRRLLRSTGISTYLVDTGLPGDLTGPAEIAATGAAEAHEIVRLEPLAERVADVSGGAGTFLAGLAESVHVAADSAVAFSSVAGARAGLAVSPEPPGPGRYGARRGAGWPGAGPAARSPTPYCCGICSGRRSVPGCRCNCTRAAALTRTRRTATPTSGRSPASRRPRPGSAPISSC